MMIGTECYIRKKKENKLNII